MRDNSNFREKLERLAEIVYISLARVVVQFELNHYPCLTVADLYSFGVYTQTFNRRHHGASISGMV